MAETHYVRMPFGFKHQGLEYITPKIVSLKPMPNITAIQLKGKKV